MLPKLNEKISELEKEIEEKNQKIKQLTDNNNQLSKDLTKKDQTILKNIAEITNLKRAIAEAPAFSKFI